MMTYSEHPLRILRYSIKNIWLLVFPLLRGINAVWTDRNWFYNWLRGAWFDILTIGVIVLFGLVRWHCSVIRLTDSAIIHDDGIIIKVRKVIPYSRISSGTVERPFYLAPFKAARFRCDTSAGIFNSADMSFMVRESTCAELVKRLPQVNEEKRLGNIPRPTLMSVVLFSVFFSSGFTGTVYIAAFFFQGGNLARDLIGRSISTLTEQTAKISQRLLLRVPDAAIGIAIFFLAAWLLSFILNLLRYFRFDIKCDDKCLTTSYGVITKREYHISAAQINYTDLRQNLIMKLFGAVAVNISCSGYGAGRRSLPVLMPVKKQKHIGDEFEPIGVFMGVKSEYRPKRTGFWQYIWQPSIIAAALVPAYLLVVHFFSIASGLALFMLIMFEIPSVWFIIVKTAAFFTSGISVYDDKIMVRCCKWTGFHTIIAERKKLVKLELEQTVFQRIGKRCSVSLWFEGEEHIKYKVKAFDEKNAVKIAELLDRNAHISANLGS